MQRTPNKPGKETLLTAAMRAGRGAFMTAAAFSLVTNLLYLALPIYTNQVYGRVLNSHSVPTLVVLTAVTVAVFVVSAAIDFYRARVLANYGVLLDQRVSGHVFTALFDGIVKREPAAGAQALRDLDTFRQTVTGSGIGVLFDLPWSPIYIIVLFLIDPWVGGLTLVGGLVLLGLAFVQDRASRPPLKQANNAALRSYGFVEAGLRNSEVVRAMGMLPSLGRKWSRDRVETLQNNTLATAHSDFWGNAIRGTRLMIQVLIIGVGAYLIIHGDIGPGMLFANMILSSRALAPIERGVASWTSLISASQAYDRLNALLTDYEPPAGTTALPRPAGALSVEGVNYAAPGGRLILTGINFKVAAGEFVGVIGPSGAGKSTLVRLLVGIWKPMNGVVRLDGADVFAWGRTDFGKHVGYLPQDTELFAGTVRDNIARFLPDVSDEEVIAAAQMAGVHELIARLPNGYDTELGAGGVVLSVGQRQRVGLARAVLRNPAYVVLDEPNANLDAAGEEALLAAIGRLKAAGSTVVVVSHKPGVLRDADKLLVLREGRMELFGPREPVLAKLAGRAPQVVNRPAITAAEAKA